jgi:hypothetical protein
LPELAIYAKRPATDLSVPGVNWFGCFVRRKAKSSPCKARTGDPAVNNGKFYRT